MRFGQQLAIIVLLAGLCGCTGVFFQPMKEHVADPATMGFTYRNIVFEAVDGVRLHGWFFPTEETRFGSVLFLHGNAENISTHFANIVWLVNAGFDVFAIDYRGYGRSSGHPDLDGLHRDVAAALDALMTMPEVDADRIAVFGQSLGGTLALTAIAVHPAKTRLRGLIVEGAFSDFRRLAREKLGGFWLTWPLQGLLSMTIDGRYDPTGAAASLSPLPLLIIHGQDDKIVPPTHGDTLFEAADQPKTIWRLSGSGHIQAFSSIGNRKRLITFLRAIMSDPAG